MLNLITSYLIQSGECVLSGIGSFTLVKTPSTLDVASKEISPPVTEYRFSDTSGQPEQGLIQYISSKKGIDGKEAAVEIKQFCTLLKERLIAGEKINFNSVGSLQMDSSANIVFDPEANQPYFTTVPAIRKVHKEVKHAMIVGDKETDSSAMNDILNGEPVLPTGNSFWKIAALILFLIGTGILFYHFYTSSSENPFGNSKKVELQSGSDTYISR